jgi:hypothetical protein
MRHCYLSIATAFAVSSFAVPVSAGPRQVYDDNTTQALSCTPIRNICELQAIGRTVATKAGSYCLANDIDASKIGACGIGASFKPIGTSAQPFTGRFNGRGFNIRNLSIINTSAPLNAEIGLFGRIGETARVHNVGVINATVALTAAASSQFNRNFVGGLAGINQGVLQNVFVTGSVECGGSVLSLQPRCEVGGLVGLNFGSIEATFTMAKIRVGWGTHNLGGLAGSSFGTIKAAHSTGPVECPALTEDDVCYAGGLVGENRGEITDSFATGHVDIGRSTGLCGVGNIWCFAGGLIGHNAFHNSSFADSPVLNSFAAGPATCFARTCQTGGLIAWADVGPIHRTYATGPANCRANGAGSLCGAAGLIATKIGTLSSSFAAGFVKCKAGFGCPVGGLIASGVPDFGQGRSYWDTESTNQSNSGNYNTAIGLSTRELQSQLRAGFDPAFWAISPKESYPYLTVLTGGFHALGRRITSFPRVLRVFGDRLPSQKQDLVRSPSSLPVRFSLGNITCTTSANCQRPAKQWSLQ